MSGINLPAEQWWVSKPSTSNLHQVQPRAKWNICTDPWPVTRDPSAGRFIILAPICRERFFLQLSMFGIFATEDSPLHNWRCALAQMKNLHLRKEQSPLTRTSKYYLSWLAGSKLTLRAGQKEPINSVQDNLECRSPKILARMDLPLQLIHLWNWENFPL